MVTETTKLAIWDGALEAARLSRYFAALASRHLKRRRMRRTTSAVAGVLAAFSVATASPELASAAGVLVLVALLAEVFWDEQAGVLCSISDDVSIIEVKYRRLFEQANSDQIEEPVARYGHEVLTDLLQQTAQRADVAVDEKLAQQAQEAAFQVEADRHAAA